MFFFGETSKFHAVQTHREQCNRYAILLADFLIRCILSNGMFVFTGKKYFTFQIQYGVNYSVKYIQFSKRRKKKKRNMKNSSGIQMAFCLFLCIRKNLCADPEGKIFIFDERSKSNMKGISVAMIYVQGCSMTELLAVTNAIELSIFISTFCVFRLKDERRFSFTCDDNETDITIIILDLIHSNYLT